nr:unnamed protein product [Digitaria exilis]
MVTGNTMSMAKETRGLTTQRTATRTGNNVPGVNSAPGWSWDTAERLLISDMDDTQGFGTAITGKSGTAPAQNVLPRVSEMDVMLGLQAMGGMAYAPAASPEVLRHTGTELQQLNPTWFPHIQHNGRHHHGGTGVYFLGTDQGAATQTQGGDGYVAGPIVGPVQHPEYQLMPAVEPPVAAWTDGSAIVPAGYHPAEARGAVYYV